MIEDSIKKLLKDLRNRRISFRKAYEVLKDLPYQDLGFAKVDHHRGLRKELGEVVFCEGKTYEEVEGIVEPILSKQGQVFLTRADQGLYERLSKKFKGLLFHKKAGIICTATKPKMSKKGRVLILTAGTGDIPVAEEARITLEFMGNKVRTVYDVGVAGIHRLFDKRTELLNASVIIVVAGMEGALASVVGGMVSKPVIGVPTSVGYGSSFKGLAPLLTMLNSCAPGVCVVNIDNGFGAGYLASLINK